LNSVLECRSAVGLWLAVLSVVCEVRSVISVTEWAFFISIDHLTGSTGKLGKVRHRNKVW